MEQINRIESEYKFTQQLMIDTIKLGEQLLKKPVTQEESDEITKMIQYIKVQQQKKMEFDTLKELLLKYDKTLMNNNNHAVANNIVRYRTDKFVHQFI